MASRASVSGTVAETRAGCPRGNVRVCSAPFVLAKIFNMIHYLHSGYIALPEQLPSHHRHGNR